AVSATSVLFPYTTLFRSCHRFFPLLWVHSTTRGYPRYAGEHRPRQEFAATTRSGPNRLRIGYSFTPSDHESQLLYRPTSPTSHHDSDVFTPPTTQEALR